MPRSGLSTAFDADAIPNELRDEPRWLLWLPEPRATAFAKRPISGTVDDPSTWLTFADARRRAARERAGIGFALGDGYAGLDFDHAIEDENIHPAVADAVARLESYAEISPSGKGVHIILRASVEQSRKLAATSRVPARELYGGLRFFTITGKQIGGATRIACGPTAQAALDELVRTLFSVGAEPRRPLSDEEILELLARAKNRSKALRLLRGDTTLYESASNADMALARIIAFYTRDPAQIDRLIRSSGLMRPKWDEARGTQTYGQITIAGVLAAGGHRYQGSASVSVDAELERRERRSWGRFRLWWLRPLQGKGPAPLMVLGVLCTYANAATGEAFPKIETIAHHTGLSKRSVISALATLETSGILFKTKRPRKSSVYQLHARMVKPASPILGREERSDRGSPEIKNGADSCTLLDQEQFHAEHALDPVNDHETTTPIDTGGKTRFVTPRRVTKLIESEVKKVEIQ